jgi:hypothetical protein
MEEARVEIHIDDPWYGFISYGGKTGEGNLNKGNAFIMRVGCLIDVISNRGSVAPSESRMYEKYLTKEALLEPCNQ